MKKQKNEKLRNLIKKKKLVSIHLGDEKTIFCRN